MRLDLTSSLLAIALLVLFSCSKDDDSSTSITDFIGTYSVMEVCDGDNYTYNITITQVGTDDETIQIFNLWDWQESVAAKIDNNKISIESQVLDGVTFSGSGSLSDNTLTIDYTTIDGNINETCQAICEKQ
ncbi:MAG: hypothetical protein AB8F74_14150 [Saprospiraceae bacterium]